NVDNILLVVEETNAVPTGNQSLQRLERIWKAADSRIPCIYLRPKYGMHIDGGLRTNSIWPAYLALKLNLQYDVLSLTLLFGDRSSPENYSVGTGVPLLGKISAQFIRWWLTGQVPTDLE